MSLPSDSFKTKELDFYFSFRSSSVRHLFQNLTNFFPWNRSQVGPSHYLQEKSFAALVHLSKINQLNNAIQKCASSLVTELTDEFHRIYVIESMKFVSHSSDYSSNTLQKLSFFTKLQSCSWIYSEIFNVLKSEALFHKFSQTSN